MTDFDKLEKLQKNFLNGKISQFSDAYIRNNQVWATGQMIEDFYQLINEQIKNGDYLPDEKYSEINTKENLKNLEKKLEALKWLKTQNGKILVLEKFRKKYLKNKSLADRKRPIQDKVIFGIKKSEKDYFEISFGLKKHSQFQKTENLENLIISPWTVEHVNNELQEKYNCNILDCLTKLSTSFLEKKFVEYWTKNYYKKENPALIPEVCGLREQFYYFEYLENIYPTKDQSPEEIKPYLKPKNFRYDFLIINIKNQKIAIIELDGFEFHKTRKQQTIDSIKRNNLANYGISLLTFTSKRIIEDVENVFKELEMYLR